MKIQLRNKFRSYTSCTLLVHQHRRMPLDKLYHQRSNVDSNDQEGSAEAKVSPKGTRNQLCKQWESLFQSLGRYIHQGKGNNL